VHLRSFSRFRSPASDPATVPKSSSEQPPSAAPAPPPRYHDKPSGFAFGARAVYGVPFGGMANVVATQPAPKLSDYFTGMGAFAYELGYRFSPHVYFGIVLDFGFVLINDESSSSHCEKDGVDCKGLESTILANLRYHVDPGSSFDPWIGIGFGYETLTLEERAGPGGPTMTTYKFRGLRYLNLELGGDFPVSNGFYLGPFATFSLGQYRSGSVDGIGLGHQERDFANRPLHGWFTFGLRGQYNL
jgi:hypothetical protein